jgi:hypothetical protein
MMMLLILIKYCTIDLNVQTNTYQAKYKVVRLPLPTLVTHFSIISLSKARVREGSIQP